MTAIELARLIRTANLADYTDRAMLADALEDAGRDAEASMLRDGISLLESIDGEIVDVLDALPDSGDLYFVGDYFEPVLLPDAVDGMTDDEFETTKDCAITTGIDFVGPEEYIRRVLSGIPFDHIVYEYCPRGFANEVSYHHSASLPTGPRVRGVCELTRSQLARLLIQGALNAMDGGSDSPPCGDYRVTEWGEDPRWDL